jgi:hypothetical protein
MLDIRAMTEWLAAYPESPVAFGFASAVALGLREPVERTLQTTARIEYARVVEALEEDAAALADAFSDEQRRRLGMPVARTPLVEAMWDGDPDHQEWKKRELERARGLLPWSRDPNQLSDEARDYRPVPEDLG